MEKETDIYKTVNIVAYLEYYDGHREYADDVIGDINYMGREDVGWLEEENASETFYKLVYPDTSTTEISKKRYKMLREADLGDLEVKMEENTKTTYKVPKYQLYTRFINRFYDNIKVPEEYVKTRRGIKNTNGDEVLSISIYSRSMRMLKHQSEIKGEDDMYVEDEDERYTAIKLRLEYRHDTKDYMDFYDDKVEEILTEVAKLPEVGRTRIMECVQEIEEKGVCTI